MNYNPLIFGIVFAVLLVGSAALLCYYAIRMVKGWINEMNSYNEGADE